MSSDPIVGLVGHGVTGSRVAAHLADSGLRVAVHHRGPLQRRRGVVPVSDAADLATADLVVLCVPAPHAALAEGFLAAGVPVVSLSDDLADVTALTNMHALCEKTGVGLVVGAGMAPGLSGMLARHLAEQVPQIDELHVAVHGTAGPACAYQHHHALGTSARGWHDGDWVESPGGSGRELVWFPEPVHAHDCYRAALADPLLLRRSFPQAQRISARVSATRRDRLTSHLPMLAPPHAAGDFGAVRVELRGALATGERVTAIAGAAGPTASLAAAVCAAVTVLLAAEPLTPGVHSTDGHELTQRQLLHHATRFGVRVQEFTGVARPTSW